MQHLIAVFLLVFLSFQPTWTLAESCCQHETGMPAQHVEHHEHQANDNPDHARAPLSSIDGDCANCYAGDVEALVGLLTNLKIAREAFDHSWPPHYLTSPPSDKPERPDWAASA
ncbi:hypothetical protein [Dechloromonas sp. CZR5]|uniref:hypothetical protein n=1 Tax=Dechloromonas sp. CZR5 TaxID=2608630 RepID=UPI00123CF004|nr:hypothetical protein [Dechloromonas sp. CZR5]